jgi:hypothetical protein
MILSGSIFLYLTHYSNGVTNSQLKNYEKVSNHCVGKRNGRATPWLLTFSGNLLTACEEFTPILYEKKVAEKKLLFYQMGQKCYYLF